MIFSCYIRLRLKDGPQHDPQMRWLPVDKFGCGAKRAPYLANVLVEVPNNCCQCNATPHISAMQNDQSDPNLVRIKIMEAIARSVLLRARYNGQTLTLAPHALFARRGDLFVSALGSGLI